MSMAQTMEIYFLLTRTFIFSDLCPTVANTGEGLTEGFHWLTDEMQGTDRNMNGFWKGVLVNNYGQLSRKGHIRMHLSRGDAGS